MRGLLELSKLLDHVRNKDRTSGVSQHRGATSEQIKGTSSNGFDPSSSLSASVPGLTSVLGPVPSTGSSIGVVKKENADPSLSSSSSSLSDACRSLLGQPLNKAEQLSNWDTRPLSSHQVLKGCGRYRF